MLVITEFTHRQMPSLNLTLEMWPVTIEDLHRHAALAPLEWCTNDRVLPGMVSPEGRFTVEKPPVALPVDCDFFLVTVIDDKIEFAMIRIGAIEL